MAVRRGRMHTYSARTQGIRHVLCVTPHAPDGIRTCVHADSCLAPWLVRLSSQTTMDPMTHSQVSCVPTATLSSLASSGAKYKSWQ